MLHVLNMGAVRFLRDGLRPPAPATAGAKHFDCFYEAALNC